MFIPVTPEICPELAADERNKWWKIGNDYYQTDNDTAITLEISRTKNGQFRWWLYDSNSPDPDMAVVCEDQPTLAEALADAYDYLDGYEQGETYGSVD